MATNSAWPIASRSASRFLLLQRLQRGAESRLPAVTGYGLGLTRYHGYTTAAGKMRPTTTTFGRYTGAAAAVEDGVCASFMRRLNTTTTSITTPIDGYATAAAANFSVPQPSADYVLNGVSQTDARTAVGCSTQSTEVWLDELIDLLNASRIRLIDVRETSDIAELGTIPCSINIPLSKLADSLALSEEQFRSTYGINKPRADGEQQVVFYDELYARSAAAVELANKLGFTQTRHYVGGWYEWSTVCRLYTE